MKVERKGRLYVVVIIMKVERKGRLYVVVVGC
jgi:hypothetical protein